MRLSIIIPVYNCAPVILRCLASIDSPEAEIIVVDDGSTDATASIVSEYARNHLNVKLLKKNNGGVSSARNLGIESASGKYIMFIDADDYLAPGGIKRIVELAENSNADVVTYRIVNVYNNTPVDKESVQDYPIVSRTIVGRGQALLRYDVPDFHVVNAVFRLATIIDNGIRFCPQLSLREDDAFCGMLYCHTDTIITTDLPLYHYVRSSLFSSTHNKSIETQRKLITSSYLAMQIRGAHVKAYCPEAMPYERLKYMRWVCHPKSAIKAGYSLSNYLDILDEYRKVGCYPLSYKWIHAAGLDYSFKIRIKNLVKTFICNHPRIAYKMLGIFSR